VRREWGVQRPDIENLIVQLDLPGPAEDHVDLLRPLVAMHQGRSLAGPKAEVSQSGLLGVEVGARHACLPPVSEAICRRRVGDVGQVDATVSARHLVLHFALSASLRIRFDRDHPPGRFTQLMQICTAGFAAQSGAERAQRVVSGSSCG
jgi:hypothetical protein